MPGKDCGELEANGSCRCVREDCLTGDSPCSTAERVYECPVPPGENAGQQYVCDGDVYCIDGSCETITREANDEFKDAVVALNTMDQAQIGRAQVRTTVTNAHLVCLLLLEIKK